MSSPLAHSGSVVIAVRSGSFERPSFEMSEKDITNILSNREIEFTLWDRIKDFFKNGIRSAVFHHLYKLYYPENDQATGNNAERSFKIFQELQLLAQDEHKQKFQVSLSSLSEGSTINFFIHDNLILSQVAQPEERERIAAILGINASDDQSMIRSEIDCLSSHLIDVSDIIAGLSNHSFATGGVHKDFAPPVMLRAKDETGERDFNHEGRLAEYVEDKPALRRYISLQEKIPAPANLDANYTYATVPCYDEEVSSTALGKALDPESGNLLPGEAAFIALQFIDMLAAFYINRVAHRDLHDVNVMFRRIYHASHPKILLQAIDFGKSQFGDDFHGHEFDDISYMFNKEACNFVETFIRNRVRNPESEKQLKHYPLHKLLQRAGFPREKADSYLAAIGARLINRLKNTDSPDEINAAFINARNEVQQLLSPRSIIPDATTRHIDRIRVLPAGVPLPVAISAS